MRNALGVFVCHCGHNIAGSVDIKRVVDEISKESDVVFCTDYIYMCSSPGQDLIGDTIRQRKLTGVVVACCSPTLHEGTFRGVAANAGLNPYRLEIANIREQCSWVHQNDMAKATAKAILIIKSTLEKVRRNAELIPIRVPITPKALVIGGGVAGIQASLDIANAGYEVYLVERSPTIGGKMVELSETFPTLDCPQCILTPKMTEVANHPKIHLYTFCEVESLSGYVGNFRVTLKHKATYVDWDKCTGCGECIEKCPSKVPSEFDHNLGKRKAIYITFPQAVPNRPTIDKENCLYFKKGICRICEKVCEVGAIDFLQVDRFEEIDVGAIIVATGFELYGLDKIDEYGGGSFRDVVDGLQFERLLSASGPTAGVVKRPSDQKVPKRVAFVQCVRSRDPECGFPYCSRVCCMYIAKQALLYKERVPDGEAVVFYIDIRSNGKGYEEFIKRARDEAGVIFVRGKVAKIIEENGELELWGADTLTGRQLKYRADMVVLAPAMVPSSGVKELATKLRIPTDEFGWIKEAHLKLRPFETLTAGIFIAGAAQYPKDITDTVAQASGAAAKVVELFSSAELEKEPLIARVDTELCRACGYCESACAYDAIKVDEKKKVSVVNEALCEGCGACAAVCPSGAVNLTNFTSSQVLNMVYQLTGEYRE